MNKVFKLNLVLIPLFCALLNNCVPKLLQKQPNESLVVPEKFPNFPTESDLEKSEAKNAINVLDKSWKLFIQDESLTNLIEIALKNNQELNILEQEINIANNVVMARQGKYLPKVGLNAGYENRKSSLLSKESDIDTALNLANQPNNYTLGMNASWEVDIWKKLRNSAKSSYYEYLSSIEGKNFAVTQLIAEIATSYYELMALDNQLEIVKEYISTLEQAQQVVEMQMFAGRTTSLAVKRFTAETLRNQSRKQQIQQQIIITENKLNSLVGRLPQPIQRKSEGFTEIAIQNINAGIPADLIENRPDIRKAALKMKVAKLNVKSVKAEFYPSLSIDANLGYQSFNSKYLVSPQTGAYAFAGGLTAPILNRKAIKAEYFSANSEQIKALYVYEQTFIKGFSEVLNQLTSLENLKDIYSYKLQQTQVLSESFEISDILFKAARIDYLESLLTRRDYLESQIELIEIKKQQLSTYVNLYKALGGGWRE